MKRILPLFFILLLFALHPVQSLACTSFAVYRDNTLYGMNFDYPDVPVRYAISQSGDMSVFHVDFQTNGRYVPIAGMNGQGLFLAVQMLYPEELATIEAGSSKIELHTFAQQALFGMKSVEEVKQQLEGQQLVNTFLTLHCMLADRSGEAVVLEPGTEQNRITQNPGDYLIMTNFSNADAYNPDTQKLEGVDCERYLAADAYIAQNPDSFEIEGGLETLKRTMQSEGGFPTQHSMVCDPVNGEIYIAIRGDFERIWRISLPEKTIEGYRGFEQPIKLKLDEQGVTAQELIDLSSALQEQYGSVNQKTGVSADGAAAQPTALSNDLPTESAAALGPLVMIGICLATLCIIAVVWLLLLRRARRQRGS